MAAPVEVELYQKSVGPPAEWRARRPGTRWDFHVTPQSTPLTLQGQLSLYFETQMTPWNAFASLIFHEPLLPEDIAYSKEGQPYLTDLYRQKSTMRNSKPPQPQEAI
jgi:hypothetical protein